VGSSDLPLALFDCLTHPTAREINLTVSEPT